MCTWPAHHRPFTAPLAQPHSHNVIDGCTHYYNFDCALILGKGFGRGSQGTRGLTGFVVLILNGDP